MPLPFSHQLRVRYGECDAQGIVFNANYLAYVDVALTEMWRQTFGSYQAMVEKGLDSVVAESRLRFRSSARFDDLLRIEGGVDPLGRTSMNLRLWMLRGEELLVESELRYVFIDVETKAKKEIPDWVREKLAPLVLAEDAGPE